ncbi:MAG: hypothetical protein IT276_00005, partial [Ignavibacteriaceae bacterium]|nr:hypothetical protein [Ignavibacteriaceae bacterium]
GADGGLTSAGIIAFVSLYVLLVFAIILKVSPIYRGCKSKILAVYLQG